MRKSRFTDEQIAAIVHEAESGARATEVCRWHSVSKETLRSWRAKYRGLDLHEARRLKQLEEESRRLKQLVAELALENSLLKDVVGRKG
ncbi:transposase [Roseisolibacter agri]|uniref:Transposase n=1 Tax=Roseisolibacter agri TaxID=2014610 RepID=A0AA37QJ03_9BACT|nr:transposase [Roseisolibacter agri]